MPDVHILIVEDENIVAKDLQHRLTALGYGITAVVSSGKEALKKVGEGQANLVLMDIRLKGDIDGVETAEEIRRKFHIPVVFLTAYADNHTLQRAKVTEPFGYILKPFEERELHTCIEVAVYKHQMERKLKESEQWLVTTLRCIGDAVMATDTDGLVKFMNPIAEALTGWTHADAFEKKLHEIFNILTQDELASIPIEKLIRGGVDEERAAEAILVGKNGVGAPIEYSAAYIRSDGGHDVGVVLVFRDIAQRKQTEEKLRYLGTHDVLTGLYNRAYFEDELLRLERGRHFPVSVIIGDVDRFKDTNDLHGHVAGDTVLKHVAQVIKAAFRAEDVVTRIGGDEFAVLMPMTDAAAVEEAVARIRTSLASYNASHRDCPLTLSLGAATAESAPLAEALKEADKRMYREKLINKTGMSTS
jgi:diguanylate cyclase (GGDEF)-like protein/PAS domain S-box-containing protein